MNSIVSQISNCAEGSTAAGCQTNLPEVAADGAALTTILSIAFTVISAMAVIIIMIQAIKFVLSQGDPEKAKNARKAIIYAAVGLALSLSANFIVIFLLRDVLS